MTNPQGTPPSADQGSAVPLVAMLFGLFVWFGAFAAWRSAEDADAPMEHYALAVCLTIVGATILLMAAIYETARRDR